MLKIYVDVESKTLQVPIKGLQRLWTASCPFQVPLSSIELPIVIRPEQARRRFHGFTIATDIPCIFTAGTFRSWDFSTKSFYYMRDPERTILINIAGDKRFDYIILEAEEDKTPESFAAEITKAVRNL